jgi:aspartate carbamoyltransferase catalytic subunit
MTHPNGLSTRHLLGIKNLQLSDVELLFQTADSFLQILERPIKKVPSLRDTTIANIFFENSTRTRLSFELAAKRLSADIINFSASSSSISKGETIIDTVKNILAMKVDMVIIRHKQAGVPHLLARHIAVPIVNAGDGKHEHPTQALLDCYTIKKRFGTLAGLSVGILGDILHSRVALSNVLLLQMLGAEVSICAPPTLIPPYIQALGVKVFLNLRQFLEQCDVVNALRIQMERQEHQYFPSSREYIHLYGITDKVLHQLEKDLVILHPGPINRGVELTSSVADGQHSLILDQVTHGVAIRMAVLYHLIGQRNA